MEISRVDRRRIASRNQLARMIGIVSRTGLILLLLASWLIDKYTIFRIAILLLGLGLLFFNYGNIRQCIPGICSPYRWRRMAAVLLYLIIVLSILCSEG